MAELEKEILSVPDLPAVVKGDGRYVMSLLKDFLTKTAAQVNLANGFTAEEITPSTDVQTPKNFFLSFDRLGAHFTWDHILKIDTLLYYELREDTNVGSVMGLLERTLDVSSDKIPASYSAQVYLYAVTKDGKSSSPATISYTKARPEEPEDLTLTKSNEGTLITFLEIPTNCVGANVYINGVKYEVYDNLFLFQGTEKIKRVEVAYFDVFGEGERTILILSLPDVTGLLVERNGDSLDFYWDALNVYGVEYVVRLGMYPEWDSAVEIFRTKLNKKKYICPKTGEYYLLIKAKDEYGNYSENAAYVSTANADDIQRNVILRFAQEDVLYSGAKVNTYYDAVSETLKLDEGVLCGEYVASIELPRSFRARNWLDYQIGVLDDSALVWDNALFAWNGEEAQKSRWGGITANSDSVTVRTQIAEYLDGAVAKNVIDSYMFDESLVSVKDNVPSVEQHADTYLNGRWAQGLSVANNTRVGYEQVLPSVFSFTFCVKKTQEMQDCVYMTLRGADGYLMIGCVRGNVFLLGSDGVGLYVPLYATMRDWLTFGVSQGETERRLFVSSLSLNKTQKASAKAKPIGIFDRFFLFADLEVDVDEG